MHTIYKYILHSNTFKISVPNDAKVLSAGVQNDSDIVVWVDIPDTDTLLKKTITLNIFNTGESIPKKDIYGNYYVYNFINTVIMANGDVKHIFYS
jgi:hypothetical protein